MGGEKKKEKMFRSLEGGNSPSPVKSLVPLRAHEEREVTKRRTKNVRTTRDRE